MANIPSIGPIHIDGMPTELYAYDTRELSKYGATPDEAIAAFSETESMEVRGHMLFADANYIVFGPKA